MQTLDQRLLARVRGLHGVEAAGLMSEVPLGQNFNIHIDLRMNSSVVHALLKLVSPEIQQIFGLRMAA